MFAGEFHSRADAAGLFRLPPIVLAAFPPPEEASGRQIVLLKSLDRSLWLYPAPSWDATLTTTRAQLDAETRRDQFEAAGRTAAEQALVALEASQQPASKASTARAGPGTPRPKGAVWVTRAGVFVDRIASAWLIRRFIDRTARFKFVTATRYAPHKDELRFDMFQAEYTHRGDRCTFEVLLQEFDLTIPALQAIAEIVHDIDLKDERYNRPEADGIAQVLHGLALAEPDDAKRLRAGAQIFDSLFAQFSSVQP